MTLREPHLGSAGRACVACLCALLLWGCGARRGENSAAKPPASPAASPATVEFKPAGVRLQAPPGWKVVPDGEHLLLTNQGGSVTTRVYSPADRSSEAAAVELDKAVEGQQVIQADSNGRRIADGMNAFSKMGSGVAGGRKVIWVLTEVSTPDDRPLALLTIFDEEKNQGQSNFSAGQQVGAIVNSLRKSQ